KIVTPDFCFKTLDDAKTILAENGLRYRIHGKGDAVYDQAPMSGAGIKKGDIVDLTIGPKDISNGPTVIMPVLTGMSIRDAIAKATVYGLAIDVKGSGKVDEQIPISGVKVSVGRTVMIMAKG
ncbi:PASTA domain-containing protein, partial [Calditrichota bacterium]